MIKTCFIFGALPVEKLAITPQENDFIIAADGGLKTLEKFNILPDLIIGDFDSLGYVPQGENILRLPVRKDDTDVGAAIKAALKKDLDRIIVYGAVGGKLDHTFANIQLASYTAEKNRAVIFIGDNICFTAINNRSLLFPSMSNRFSVFCIGGKAEGVTIKGSSYELDNAELTPDYPLGVSNEGKNNPVFISVKQGVIAVFWEDSVLPDFKI